MPIGKRKGGTEVVILGTLIVTWIVKNWWKILLLLAAVIILYEYQIRKHPENRRTYKSDTDKAADPVNDIPPPFGRDRNEE